MRCLCVLMAFGFHQNKTSSFYQINATEPWTVLTSLDEFILNLIPPKKKILGSIFPEMIEFDGIKCRSPKINEVILLCLNANKGFRQNKNGTTHGKLELSRLVGDEGFEPPTPSV